MSTCPCCHEPLPDSENPDQLCSECSHALDTGLERLPSASPHQSAAQDHPAKSRPLIITILALQNFLAATCGLLMGVILLVSAKLAAALLTAVSRQSLAANLLPFDLRLKYSLCCFFCALLIGLLAVGLWQVRNWARRIVIASFMLDVMFGGSFLLLWPLHTMFDADPVLQILGRLLTFAVVCYLFSRSVKSAFGLADFGHWWLYASAAVALFSLGFALYKSKTEFQAWRWHRQHGNQVQFEGITFPVYRWYVPHVSEADLRINDEPGPLRPDDRLAFITIESCRQDCTVTPRELAEKKIESYKRAGYTDVKLVQRQIKGETLECVEQSCFPER